MSGATVSVVLATRNGSRFVDNQLRTVLAQDRPPDEVVVCDDASTDGTPDLVRRAAFASTTCFRIIENDRQLGPVGAFERAIAAAQGDIVVLADQDDAWRADRLGRLESALTGPLAPLAVFSDARLVDATGEALPGSLWRAQGVGRRARRRLHGGRVFEQLLRWNVVTGATLAMRAELVPMVVPMTAATMHDYWIALVAASLDGLVALAEPLVDYRLHDGNAVGVPGRGAAIVERRRDDADARPNELAMFRAVRARVEACGATPARVASLDRKIQFLERRAALHEQPARRLGPVVTGVVTRRYATLAHGARSAAHDLVFGR